MLDPFHNSIDCAFQERNIPVKLVDQLGSFVKVQIQLCCQFVLAHSVHQTQTNCLGSLAFNAGHVGNHLVKVSIWIIFVRIHHFVSSG